MNFTVEEYRIILAAEKATEAANKATILADQARESARKRVVTPEQLQKLTEDRLAYQTDKAEYSRQDKDLTKIMSDSVKARSILRRDWFNRRKSFQSECIHEFSNGPDCIHCECHM